MVRPIALTLFALAAVLTLDFRVVSSQTIEEWQIFSALDRTRDVRAAGDGRYLVGTSGGGYLLAADGEILRTWRSDNELLRLDVSAVGYDVRTGDYYFGSSDGAVSVLREGGWWTYLIDIATAPRPERRINRFVFDDGNAYILTSFGVVEFRSSDSTIQDTWTRLGTLPEGTEAVDLAFVSDSILVATPLGLAVAARSASNLADPTSWRVVPADPTTCGSRVTSIATIGPDVYVAGDSGVCRYVSGTFASRLYRADVAQIVGAEDRLVLLESNAVVEISTAGAELRRTGLARSGMSLAASDSTVIAGLDRSGIVLIPSSGTDVAVIPPGPRSNRFEDLAIDRSGDVWVATGTEGVLRYDRSEWYGYSSDLDGLTTNSSQSIGIDSDGLAWSGSFGEGFFRFDSDPASRETPVVVNFDESNSSLKASGAGETFVIGTGTATDQAGVMWALNWDNTTASRVLLHAVDLSSGTPTWYPYAYSGSVANLTREYRDIVVDLDGTKWIGGDGQQGLLYYVDGESLDRVGTWGLLRTSSGLLSNDQTAMHVDRDGELWIGTPKGISILVNPFSVARQGAGAAIFREIGFLDDVFVRDIAADALNRKWIATDEGLFVLSSDGIDLLARFESGASPLSDNRVLSIAVEEATGTIFVGTANGLNRIRTDAVASTERGTITASPQPFRIGAGDRLRITGLPDRSILKVLTPAGHLVTEIPTPGGDIAYWDGTDESGDPVPNGVYLLAAESPEGQTSVGKIAVLRR